MDLHSGAFKLRDADFTIDADGTPMRFWTNLLDHTFINVAANASAIIARTDDLMNPLEDVGLFTTDEHGQPRWCMEILGPLDLWRSDAEGAEFVVVADATYAMLLSPNAEAVEAVWAELKACLSELGLDQPDVDDSSVEVARGLILDFVREPPFVAFNADLRPDHDRSVGDWKRLPAAMRKVFYQRDMVDDAGMIFMELMLRQAGVRLPSKMDRSLVASVFSSTFLQPLLDVMPRTSKRLRPHLTPSDGWNGDVVLAARPAAGRLYLTELFIREMRRRRRNALWRDVGIAYWRGAAGSVVYGVPNPSAEAAITAAASAAIPSLSDPIIRMFAVREHCDWIRKLASQHVTATGLTISDQSLDATVSSLRWRMLPGAWLNAEEHFAHDEFGLSPLYSFLAAGMDARGSALTGSSGHDCPTEVRSVPLPLYTPSEEQLVKESTTYLYHCLFGVDLYYREYEGRSYESRLDEDDVERATVTNELMKQLSGLLDGCPMTGLICEGLLRGDHGSLQLRLLDARQNVGGDWSVEPPAESAASQTTVLETLNNVLTPAVTILGVFKSYYEGAVESEVWRLIRAAGGPGKDPATLMENVAGFFERAKKLIDLFEKKSPTTLVFSIVAQVALDEYGTKISATLLQKGGAKRASALVDLYVIEKRGAVGAWQNIKDDDLEADVTKMAERASERDLTVPAVFEAFASVVGLTVTLMNFDKDLGARATSLGKAVVVGKVAEGVLSTTSSVLNATRSVLNALPEGFLIPLIKNGSKDVRFTRLLEGLGGVAKWTGTVAEGVGSVLAVGELADTFLDPGSGLNKAVRTGDRELTAAQYNKTGFLAVSAAAGVAGMLGIAGIAVTGPIGVVCGFAIIVIDAYIAEIETEYHTLVARGVLQFEQSFAHRRWDLTTHDDRAVSEVTSEIYELLDAMKSMTATAAYGG